MQIDSESIVRQSPTIDEIGKLPEWRRPVGAVTYEIAEREFLDLVEALVQLLGSDAQSFHELLVAVRGEWGGCSGRLLRHALHRLLTEGYALSVGRDSYVAGRSA